MSFKEQVEKDIIQTFLNEKEFAEMHEIGDGNISSPCLMVIYDASKAGVINGVDIREAHKGVFIETKNLMIPHELGCTVFIDGQAYTIENEPTDSMGMTNLLLKRLY